ncbi:MAG: GNAT family N-acetyltransferase [Moritella sp.]|uniref:GNAT family N-acetyltransferase n=1 Tax=Moritella sp. TaxID=78556 RepID=UPI0025CF5AEB|nr:GNAT family N-acetyltransferase [Moritella sp.]NQZ93417.1 GNAT family N-acetyltransferase [Moritella sp.]
MVLIQEVEINSPHLITLYQWLESEWDDVEPLAPMKNGQAIPNPIIALKDGELVGGLVFTRFLSPITEEQAVWINAVFIKDEERKQGISSQLINRAEKLVKEIGESELLVFTEIKALYSKLNWQVIETVDKNFVLKSSLV